MSGSFAPQSGVGSAGSVCSDEASVQLDRKPVLGASLETMARYRAPPAPLARHRQSHTQSLNLVHSFHCIRLPWPLPQCGCGGEKAIALRCRPFLLPRLPLTPQICSSVDLGFSSRWYRCFFLWLWIFFPFLSPSLWLAARTERATSINKASDCQRKTAR